MPSRLAPLLALALGVGVVGAVTVRPEVARALLWGVVLGLTACGLYSGGRALVGTASVETVSRDESGVREGHAMRDRR
jgi:hypothetical protein